MNIWKYQRRPRSRWRRRVSNRVRRATFPCSDYVRSVLRF